MNYHYLSFQYGLENGTHSEIGDLLLKRFFKPQGLQVYFSNLGKVQRFNPLEMFFKVLTKVDLF